jgi:Glycosyl transferases group 1
MNKLAERIFHYLYLALNYILLAFLATISPVLRRKTNSLPSILALPYTPQNWPGGYDRMHAWQSLFVDDGWKYDVKYAWTKSDNNILEDRQTSSLRKYFIYSKILFQRIRHLFILHQYQTIWVQRAFVPAFPFKDAYYEKLLAKFHPNIIYDFYDADYTGNYTLVMNTVKAGHKITVATPFLKAKLQVVNPRTFLLRYAIETSNFQKKKSHQQIRIGWMGSPGNAKNLEYIKSQLQEIKKEYGSQVVFTFVCRELPALEIDELEHHVWGENKFDYNEWLAGIDIGIVPFLNPDERTKAKISMKGLEFMANSIPMVCSAFIHTDQLIDKESFLLAHDDEWYHKIKILLDNKNLQSKMGMAAKVIFDRCHSYPLIQRDFIEIMNA